ncbi:MAG: hypothetical protein COT14_03320 [Candidatus Diapherotrites archaeon CG08_land_8_20_14_0_20_30_16]|nr:MAG: hypothetical protein COT14_03320 [Candidatus Diapherotrites archaeon CG08_land_8_20_14_0_20_30_16]
MLKSLILNNWKSHKNTEINFSQGYNVLVGNIGTGKSSIFDGIVFALFGTTPNITSKKVPLKDLIMSKPVEEKESTITLDLSIGNDNYKIERTLYRTKTSQAKIYKNDALLRGPKPSDVTEEVEKLLNINLDTFMKANYAEQNSIDYFLKLPANERKVLFDNLFDISFYDNISVNARQVNNKLKTKNEDLQQKTNEYKRLLENYNKEKTEHKLKSIQKDISAIREQLQQFEKLRGLQKEKESEISKQKQDFETTTNLLNNLIGKEKYLETEIIKLKEVLTCNIEKLEQQMITLKEDKQKITNKKQKEEQEYNNIRSKTLFYNNKLTDLNTKQADFIKIEAQLKEIPKEINDLVNKLVQEIEKSRENITQNETKINTTELDIKTLEKSIANCPLCTQELAPKHKEDILIKKEQEKKQLEELAQKERKIYEQLKKDYDQKNKQREYYNRNIEVYEKIKSELVELDKYKKLIIENQELELAHKKRLETTQKDLDKIETVQKDLENKLKQIFDFENKQKDLQKIKEELKAEKEKLDHIKYNPEEYTKIKELTQKLTTEHQYKQEIILEKEKQQKEEQFKLAQYNQILENKDKAEKESQTLARYIDDFTIISNVSKKTQEQVRQYVVESINIIFQDLWQQIYPYKDFQNIKFNVNEGDYKIELFFNNEYKRELDEFISGGERSAIALALRIAMCLVMKNKLNLVILDEPTHNLDKKTILSLSNLFNNYLPQFVDQIFVITHDSDLEQYANNVYYISRNKETDGATEINVK